MATTPTNPYTGSSLTQPPQATTSNLGLGAQPPSNPYLSSQATAITNASNQNLQNNVLPGIDSGAVAAGGYGGSRQGIADGTAIGQAQTGLDSSLANLYGNAYTSDQNYNLGLGSLANTAQANQNTFYSQNRQLDQSGASLGGSLVTNANTGLVGQGSGVSAVGGAEQQAPWTVTNNLSNTLSPYSGLGGGQINTQQGSTLGAALGTGILGSQIISNLGLGTSNGSGTNPVSGLPLYLQYANGGSAAGAYSGAQP